MKVCIIPNSAVGGVDRHIRALKQHLPDMGVEFVGISEAEILHFHAAVPVKKARVKPSQRIVYTNHGIWSLDPTAQMPDWARRERKVIIENLNVADAVICPSRWQAREYHKILGIDCRIIPNGIELSEWESLSDLPTRWAGMWGKNRVDEIFDPTDFFDLVAIRDDCKFAATLPDPETPALDNLDALGVLPFRALQEVLAQSKMLVTTASREFFGIQTLEAMVLGKPVLAKRGGGNSDLITHKADGFLYDTFTEMLEGFDYCLTYTQMGKWGRLVALQYQWVNIAKMTYQVYEEVLSGNSTRGTT